MNILITGGAGFIGTNLSRFLLAKGAHVRVLDNFSPQIHSSATLPRDISGSVELIHGDVRDRKVMKGALSGIHGIVHLAAETGTGQSMYEIERYFSVNVQGTATMLDLLQNEDCGNSLRSIVVASSRAVYGEGAYWCQEDGMVFPGQRSKIHMIQGKFDPVCPNCGRGVELMKTPESAPCAPISIYGLTKQVQEQAVLMFARTRGINGFGLRYQNVYGPGQSLKNPYTGILAIFSNLARHDQQIDVYEDGLESRDFVYIDDVVDATARSVLHAEPFVGALNVGTGQATSVLSIAETIRDFLGSRSIVRMNGNFREGDIRHNIADTSRAEHILGYLSKTHFRQGVAHFLEWAREQAPADKTAYRRSLNELSERGLMGKMLAS